MTSKNPSWTRDGSEPKTAADEENFNDVDQFDDGVSANIQMIYHGDAIKSASWGPFAKKAFYMAHNEESIADVINKRLSLSPVDGVKIDYSIQPGPYAANVRIDIHSVLEPPARPILKPKYTPPIWARKSLGPGGECGYILTEPGKRFFTEMLGYDVTNGSGGPGTEEFETVEAVEDNQGDWDSCNSTDWSDPNHESNHFGRPKLDLPFDFKFAGKAMDAIWMSGWENYGFSGPWMMGRTYGTGPTLNGYPCGGDESLSPARGKEYADQQYRISTNGRWGVYNCTTFQEHRSLGTKGEASFPALFGSGGSNLGFIFDLPEVDQWPVEFDDPGAVSQFDRRQVAGMEEHEKPFGAIGGVGAQKRKFFCVTSQQRRKYKPEGGLETEWNEDTILTESQIVLLPKTSTCPAAVGVFTDEFPEDLRVREEDYKWAGVTGEPWCGMNNKFSDGNGPPNPDYDPDGSSNIYTNWPELGNSTTALTGEDNVTIAWVHGQQSTKDGAGDRSYPILRDRCFWFILDDDGYAVDAVAQKTFRMITEDHDGDGEINHNQLIEGDIGIGHPEAGVYTV